MLAEDQRDTMLTRAIIIIIPTAVGVEVRVEARVTHSQNIHI